MVAMIERLIALGTLMSARDVLFKSVRPDYGASAAADREAMLAGAGRGRAVQARSRGLRVVEASSEGSSAGIRRGAGRPAGTIECSAMIRGHLGATIDIHGGGST